MEAFNIKFVGEVENYPELYNDKLQAYSKRDATEKAWNNIAKEVKLSVNECKEKWRNLRGTFVKILKPKPSGAGATKKKPYYLMEAMQFAIPFVKVAGNPTGNLPQISQTSSHPTSPDVYDTDNTEEGDQDFADTEAMFDLPGITSPPLLSPSAISNHSSSASQAGDRVSTPTSLITTETTGPHGLPTRRRKTVPSDAADKAFTEYLSAKQAKLSMPPPVKDERDKREEGIQNFVISLIPDLMQFNDVQLRTFKRKSLLVIDEISDSAIVSSNPGMELQSNNQVLPSNNQVLLSNNHVLPSNNHVLPSNNQGHNQTFDEDLTHIPGNRSQYPSSSFDEMTEETDNVGLQTVNDVGDILREANALNIEVEIEDRVENADETLLDCMVLSSASGILKRCIEAVDVFTSTYDSTEFANKVISYIGQDEEDETIDITMLLDEARKVVPKVPDFNYVYGSYDLNKLPVPKQKKERQKVIKEKLRKKEPENVTNVDKEEEGIEQIVKMLFDVLDEAYTKNHERPIYYYDYIIDTESYANTIENMFYFAFLIRDGRAHLEMDKKGLPIIKPMKKRHLKKFREENGKNSQIISSITMDIWEKYKKEGLLQIQKKTSNS